MDRFERYHYADKADWLAMRIGVVLSKGGRVLDVGAGNGANLKLARKIGGTHVTALEPCVSVEARANLDEADQLIETDLHSLAINKDVDEYDTVLAMNVQIIGDEEQFIAEIAQLLKDQGTAVFSFAERERMDRLVPHIQKHFSEMQVRGNYYDKDRDWGPDHIVIVAKKNGTRGNAWLPRTVERVDPLAVHVTVDRYRTEAYDLLPLGFLDPDLFRKD